MQEKGFRDAPGLVPESFATIVPATPETLGMERLLLAVDAAVIFTPEWPDDEAGGAETAAAASARASAERCGVALVLSWRPGLLDAVAERGEAARTDAPMELRVVTSVAGGAHAALVPVPVTGASPNGGGVEGLLCAPGTGAAVARAIRDALDDARLRGALDAAVGPGRSTRH